MKEISKSLANALSSYVVDCVGEGSDKAGQVYRDWDRVAKILDMMPNGFESWYETYFYVATEVGHVARQDKPWGIVLAAIEQGGSFDITNLAVALTNEFEKLNEDREWHGEYLDELEDFIENKLKEI